jgi:hypothetical protein
MQIGYRVHHEGKAYGGLQAQFHLFLTSQLDRINGQLQTSAALPPVFVNISLGELQF